jgi:hypothetical protein
MEARLLAIEKLDEDHRRALWNNEVMQVRRKIHHDKLGKVTTFSRRDLVMLVDNWLMKHHGQ